MHRREAVASNCRAVLKSGRKESVVIPFEDVQNAPASTCNQASYFRQRSATRSTPGVMPPCRATEEGGVTQNQTRGCLCVSFLRLMLTCSCSFLPAMREQRETERRCSAHAPRFAVEEAATTGACRKKGYRGWKLTVFTSPSVMTTITPCPILFA